MSIKAFRPGSVWGGKFLFGAHIGAKRDDLSLKERNGEFAASK
jgi:hypothetical protein